MPIEVQIVLPDNLRSSYLRGDFVEQGKSYSSDKISIDVSQYESDTSYNQHDLVLGFKLVDTETREEVPLSRIASLRISNDSEFHASNTVIIENWPAAPTAFDKNKNYRRKLNPLFFTEDSVQQYRTGWDDDGDEAGNDEFTGFFIIEGWPLSASGGLSAVYLQAELLASGSSQTISYPNGYGLFDQIFWQSERPSTPGKPYIINTSGEYTGKKTTWEFGASSEHASARYNTGISRYVSDIIELRTEVDGISNAFYSTQSGFGNTNIRRTILPEFPAQHTFHHGYAFDGITFGASLGALPAHIPMLITADEHISAITVEEVDMDVKRPDVAVHACMEIQNTITPAAATTFYIGVGNNEWNTPNVGNAYIVKVSIPSYGAATSQIYRLTNGVKTPNAIVTVTLPEYVADKIRLGGLLELYATDRNDGLALVKAYITPLTIRESEDTSPFESYLIADAVVQSLGTYSFLGGIMGGGANEDCDITFHELAIAAGRFVLGGDEGDCTQKNSDVVEFPHVQIDSTDHLWSDNLDTDFTTLTHTSTPYGDAATAVVNKLYLRAPSSDTSPSYSEIQAHMPSFGLRTFIDFELAHYSGDFYIALSQVYSSFGVPSGLRCEFENIENSSPETIMICFRTETKSIEVRQRLANGSLTKRKIRKYVPNDKETVGAETFTKWSLRISSVPPKGRGEGTWLIINKDDEFWGSYKLDLPLSGSISNTGWYIGAGVRGGINGNFSDWSETNNLATGYAVLKSFSMKPEHVVKTLDNNAPVNYRRFSKGKTAQHNAKHHVGQRLVSSITDKANFPFKVPVAPETYANVQLVATENISFGSAPNFVNGIPVVANNRILCINQNNSSENGIYIVNSVGTGSDGIWTRSSDLSISSHVQYGNRVEVDSARYARLALVPNDFFFIVDGKTITSMPAVVDGVLVRNNDTILIISGDFPERNGLYTVITAGTGSNGIWTRKGDANTVEEFPSGTVIFVLSGDEYGTTTFYSTTVSSPIIDVSPYTIVALEKGAGSNLGTAWYVDSWLGDFQLDLTSLTWKSAMFTQLITLNNVNKLTSTEGVFLNLSEALIRPSQSNFKPSTAPKIRFYEYVNYDTVGNPLSQWHFARTTNDYYSEVGQLMSKNNLIQFDVFDSAVFASEGNKMWMSIMLPSGCEMAAGNSKRMGETELFTEGGLIGASRAYGVWHKTFLYSSERYNNALNGAYIQTRTMADSHANIMSHASLLSEPVVVDRVAPGYFSSNRPRITEVQEPSARSAIIGIECNDDDSGLLAFRIIKEGDDGIAKYEPWQNWNHFVSYRSLTTVKAVKTSAQAVLNGSPGAVDGFSDWVDGDRILLTAQSSSTANGIYAVNLYGSWQRVSDFNEDSELRPNLRVSVEEGEVYAGTTWYLHLPSPNSTPPYYVMGATSQVWLTTAPESSTAHYTVYLHSKWSLDSDNEVDTEILTQNQSMDGSRRIWVQVMDVAGNISESEPLTITAQALALVDTTPPTGNLTIVNPANGASLETTKSTLSTVKLALEDRITDVKDVRVRLSQAGVGSSWSSWSPYLEYIESNIDANVPSDTLSADGLKRIEAQFRDYGNNAIQAEPLWEIIKDTSNTTKIFTCSCTWTPPGSDKEWLYLGGIELKKYENYTLAVSNDPEYSSGDAYLAKSAISSDLGRTVYVRDIDDITLTVNSEEWTRFTPLGGEDLCYGAPAKSYRVDNDRGLIVFCDTLPSSPTFNITISRKSGVLYRWDGSKLEYAYDIGGYGEKGILSMLPLNDYIALGGYSGNIWGFDGQVVVPSLFTLTEDDVNLPVSFLTKFKFNHESDNYVYAGTSIKPRLYRFKFSNLDVVGGLEKLGSGFLQTTLPGSLTCAVGEYNKLFIGTDSNKIIQYRRENDALLGDIESALIETELRSKFIGLSEPYSMPVSTIVSGGNQVIAGIGNKPEVWSYTEKIIEQPITEELWSTTYFDRWFANSPAPWQFFATETNQASGGITTSSENNGLVYWAAITEPNSEIGMRELITINGDSGRSVIFRTDSGSDWEQSSSNSENWMMEFELMHIDGDGKQSIEIADGRYRLRLNIDSEQVELISGENTVMVNHSGDSNVVAMSQLGGIVYPERGNIKVWNFSGGTGNNDYGPYWNGEDASGSTDNWLAGDYVIPFENNAAGEIFIENENDTSTFVREKQSLRVQALVDGDPVIYWKTENSGINVDNSVYFYVRMRLNSNGLNTNDAKLSMAWSPVKNPSPQDFVFSESVSVSQHGNFATYKFTPSWVGTMNSIAIQLQGVIQESDGPVVSLDDSGDYTFDIDYISCNTDSGVQNITDNFTPFRIGVSDKDVKIWVGKNYTPLINESDFLGWPTEKSEIIFGKIDLAEPQSKFGWSCMRYYIGNSLPPVTHEVKDFDLMWRFPSSGGVTAMTSYQGSLWAFTQGYPKYNAFDNPDSRTAHAYSYNRTDEHWSVETPGLPRDEVVYGFVNIRTAAQYQNSLVVCSDKINIMQTPE